MRYEVGSSVALRASEDMEMRFLSMILHNTTIGEKTP